MAIGYLELEREGRPSSAYGVTQSRHCGGVCGRCGVGKALHRLAGHGRLRGAPLMQQIGSVHFFVSAKVG